MSVTASTEGFCVVYSVFCYQGDGERKGVAHFGVNFTSDEAYEQFSGWRCCEELEKLMFVDVNDGTHWQYKGDDPRFIDQDVFRMYPCLMRVKTGGRVEVLRQTAPVKALS